MGIFSRLKRILGAEANNVLGKAEDPGKILEQAVIEMQENLGKMRSAVATAIALKTRTEQQIQKKLADQDVAVKRATMAATKLKAVRDQRDAAQAEGDTAKYNALAAQYSQVESLAKTALEQKNAIVTSLVPLQAQLEGQATQVAGLKDSLIQLEGKINEAKQKKSMLSSRAEAAKAQKAIGDAVSGVDFNSAMGAFDRMEEKVLKMEAAATGVAQLTGQNLDAQFAALEAGSVDDELAALMGDTPAASLPSASKPVAALPADPELEQLKKELGQ
jgi:phage shock protein A